MAASLAGLRPVAAVTIWEVGHPQGHVEVREALPAPKEFFLQYLKNEGGPFAGFGKPVLFPNAARRMPAFQLWTDDYLKEHYGTVRMDQVETEKKETRKKFPHEDWNLARFLEEYNSSDIYSTAQTPAGLSDEVFLLPSMNCGGFHRRMSQTVTWFSSGSTKSVIHSDGQQNFHCMFSGRKDWILWHPKTRINSPDFGWVNAEEEAEHDPSFKDAYGSYVGRVDVDDVDLVRYPGWSKEKWWNMTLREGDCAFIPARWYHYVEAPPQRSISVHVWFASGKNFDQKSCDALEARGYNVSDYLIRLSDCTWGWEEGKAKATKCRVPRSTTANAAVAGEDGEL